jgi:hypothetical protein
VYAVLFFSTTFNLNSSHYHLLDPSKTILSLLLEIAFRLPRRMRLHMIIKLLLREFPLTHCILIFMCCDAVFVDAIAMAVFHGLGDVGGVGGFVTVPWLCGFRRMRGDWRGGGSGGRWRCGGGGGCGVVESCSADGGGCREPRGSWYSMSSGYCEASRGAIRVCSVSRLLTTSIAMRS